VDDGFQEYVTSRYADLLRTAYLLGGGRHAAEDLLQNALLKTMRRWSRIEDPDGYLYRTMANLVISAWRRPAYWRERLTAAVPDRAASDDTADRVSNRAQLLDALASLPPRMRAVLVLRYWEDMSEADTADLLECSVGSVKSQASRGLARMRSVLRPDVATAKGSAR
jgi:RNA polymerase sigma-70 factor (sigma-E family)